MYTAIGLLPAGKTKTSGIFGGFLLREKSRMYLNETISAVCGKSAENDPPTYANAGGNDLWHLDRAMVERQKDMQAAGLISELMVYEGLPHGYALGRGTIAEGWHEEAITFRETHR